MIPFEDLQRFLRGRVMDPRFSGQSVHSRNGSDQSTLQDLRTEMRRNLFGQ